MSNKASPLFVYLPRRLLWHPPIVIERVGRQREDRMFNKGPSRRDLKLKQKTCGGLSGRPERGQGQTP
jgi:hypothetical protein